MENFGKRRKPIVSGVSGGWGIKADVRDWLVDLQEN
jgi:hypothetical protein